MIDLSTSQVCVTSILKHQGGNLGHILNTKYLKSDRDPGRLVNTDGEKVRVFTFLQNA